MTCCENLMSAEQREMKVWVVFVGNYFPREVEAIYATETAAKAHADDDDGDLNYEAWTVAEEYKATAEEETDG